MTQKIMYNHMNDILKSQGLSAHGFKDPGNLAWAEHFLELASLIINNELKDQTHQFSLSRPQISHKTSRTTRRVARNPEHQVTGSASSVTVNMKVWTLVPPMPMGLWLCRLRLKLTKVTQTSIEAIHASKAKAKPIGPRPSPSLAYGLGEAKAKATVTVWPGAILRDRCVCHNIFRNFSSINYRVIFYCNFTNFLFPSLR